MSTTDDLLDENPNRALRLAEDDALSAFLAAVATEFDAFDARINEVYDDVFINTASYDALVQHAEEIGVEARGDDTVESLRTKINAAYGRATSTTTIRQFGNAVQQVLNADPNEITVEGVDTGEPRIILTVAVELVDEAPLSIDTIVELIEGSIPAGHALTIQTRGSFRFDGDGYTPPENSGFGEGAFGGELT